MFNSHTKLCKKSCEKNLRLRYDYTRREIEFNEYIGKAQRCD